MVPDQNIASILAMAGGGSQTSAGPISESAEAMAMKQAQQPTTSRVNAHRYVPDSGITAITAGSSDNARRLIAITISARLVC